MTLPNQLIPPEKKNKKKKKNKTIVNYDPSKKACKYIVIKKNTEDELVYGRYCNDICINSLHGDLCNLHINAPKKNYDILATVTCRHIITQKSGNKDRKGMYCGNFIFNSPNPLYCKDHVNQYPKYSLDDPKICARSFKVRIYPTSEQKKKLIKYFGDCRYTYNHCVSDDANGSFNTLRDKYVTEMVNNINFINTPKEIRASAVNEFITNKENAYNMYEYKKELELWKLEKFKNYKAKTIKKPEMKFKKKKAQQSISINKNSINIIGNQIQIYPESFSNELIKVSTRTLKRDKRYKRFIENKIVYHDIDIIKTLTNKYYICIVEGIPKKEYDTNINMVACDTGGRTFITTYSENESIEIGNNMTHSLGNMIKKEDQYKKIYKNEIKKLKIQEGDRQEYNKSKMKYRKMIEKIKNCINDLHYKAITKLSKYSLICIPKLNIKKIMMEKKIPKMARRILHKQSHSGFIKRLKEKGEMSGIYVKVVSEHLTTKTCGRCFNQYNVESAKTYDCPTCKLKIDRDINAARNIYIQQLSLLLE
jgi:putative transposase